MAHNKARDSSSLDVSEEVLRRGGSTTVPTTLGAGAKGVEVDPPLAGTGASR
ncbi:UNVERIFIED_CONTAM: hypothetical protein Sradi_1874500 [Sesamum radiatum]|uniref:Uncharacterized protein n=1 Tax=Sesamum radiatum TaxID=300843 RepID=A0AAW2TWL9_SESRA